MGDIKIASLTAKTTFVNTDIMIVEDATDTKKMTMASLKSYFMNIAHPIGEVYTSVVNTNPATLFGIGTWVVFGTGKVLVGVDTAQTEFNTVEKIGGEKAHVLTVAELPATTYAGATGAVQGVTGTNGYWQFNATNIITGLGTAHNNLQPFITVYMWKRTA